jgi:radical SAM protein (TIGR01212 family)
MKIDSDIQSLYPWGHSRRFNAYSNYFRKIYGGRLQKISIDAGFTCPNRDGTAGTGGCTYCNNDAFNPSYCDPANTISNQLGKGMEFLRKRYREPAAYLAYFQAFSNTYAPLDRLKVLYEEALTFPGIKGLIIGTRPDCIDTEKLEYFRELSEKHFIAIEYGVESCYDKTLRRINRGHSFRQAADAIRMTAERGIKTGAHFIFGLPGETRDEMLMEAEIISALPLHTVKFHQLQIIKGTFMEKEYLQHPTDFNLFSFDDYVNFFILFLERLNPEIVVERFTGEAPPDYLLEQRWNKRRTDEIVRIVEKKLEELNTWQGRLYEDKRQSMQS